MPTAAVRRYWDWLPDMCVVCGSMLLINVHHIIHINGQRITKDHWLVVKLCHDCHQTGKVSVHGLGGEAKFLEVTGWDLVAIAVLNRHNFEMRAR